MFQSLSLIGDTIKCRSAIVIRSVVPGEPKLAVRMYIIHPGCIFEQKTYYTLPGRMLNQQLYIFGQVGLYFPKPVDENLIVYRKNTPPPPPPPLCERVFCSLVQRALCFVESVL